jgi:hypothetical protein
MKFKKRLTHQHSFMVHRFESWTFNAFFSRYLRPLHTDMFGSVGAQVLWKVVTSTLPWLDYQFLNLTWFKNELKLTFLKCQLLSEIFWIFFNFSLKKNCVQCCIFALSVFAK